MRKLVLVFAILVTAIGAGLLGYTFKKANESVSLTKQNNSVQQIQSTANNISESSIVDFSNKGLIDFPKSVLDQITTIQLILSHNSIKSLPADISKLTKLQLLFVDHNNLVGSLPAEIRLLSELKSLNVSNNFITAIPAETGQLAALETLNYSYNSLDTMPNEIKNCKKLTSLDLSYNNYKTMSDALKSMTGLKDLNLVGNPISSDELASIRKSLPTTNVQF